MCIYIIATVIIADHIACDYDFDITVMYNHTDGICHFFHCVERV